MKLDGAFPPTPKAFDDAIIEGIRKGKRKMKFRNKLKLATVAAMLMVCVGIFAFAIGGNTNTDGTAAGIPAQGGQTAPNADDIVAATPEPRLIMVNNTPAPQPGESVFYYATEHGKFYHINSDCSGMDNAIQMTEEEALEKGKLPCPVCLPDYGTGGTAYEHLAFEILEEVFPGADQLYMEHYNLDQLLAEYEVTPDGEAVMLKADELVLGKVCFNGDSWELELYFNDTTVSGIIKACAMNGSVSRLADLIDRDIPINLLGDLLNAVHASAASGLPLTPDAFKLTKLKLCYTPALAGTGYDELYLYYKSGFYDTAELVFNLEKNNTLVRFTLDADNPA